MSLTHDTVGETELQFFGKICASISHEIKNALAVMNEIIGLVEDLCLMADKGLPLDAKGIRTLARGVLEQIRRADSIVNNMNRFAHSADEVKQRIDLGDPLALVASFSERAASVRGVTFTVETDAKPVRVTTNPFVLQNLLWLCLDFAMDATGEAKTVGVVAEDWENGGRFRFTGLKGLSGIPAGSFPSEKERALLDVLNAGITTDVEREELLLMLPNEIAK